ncbi:hypothetical protein Tco_1343176 [Tanacetum coccineum]
MELVLEQTQQGTSHEVSVSLEGVKELKRKVKIKGEKKEALLTLRQKAEHQSDTKVFTMTMEILLEPPSNKLLVGDLCDSHEANLGQLERNNDSILQAGNPVKDILLKLNLPDHRLILTDSKVNPTKHGRMTKPYSSSNFIANYFIADSYKDEDRDFRYSDTVRLSRSDEVLKLKNFKKDVLLQAVKLNSQE